MTASRSARAGSTTTGNPTTLRFILGDQLSRSLSALDGLNVQTDLVLMAEVGDEASYVPHHKKKLAFLFSAMRHFAAELQQAGAELRYVTIDDGVSSLTEALQQAVADNPGMTRVIVTEAAEQRVLDMQRDWAEELGLDVEIRTDDRFLCPHDRFRAWAGDEPKSLRMEYFYRMMRKETGYLMEGDEPAGGQWNFDKENREALPPGIEAPSRPSYSVDDVTRDVLKAVAARFDNNFGDLEPFDYPVTRRQALHYLNWFVTEALPDFGTYQDAMRQGEPLLFHSHLSALINCGLLDPRECCDRAEEAWRDGKAPLNAVEGFIRQIIGWREFIRGVYWLKMPGYGTENALKADRKLPDFFWTAETDMNCLRQSIAETKANAYAHHIQRLMVIGNFSLIAGLDPREVQEWYLLVYHDAYEWVEMPNVVGMSLYADGGFFASKPYAASGSYIDKMSNYCEHCRYDVKKKNGEKACPFNYLYWDFLMRNRERLAKNQRMGMILGTLGKMSDEKKDAIRADSERFFKSLK
jgi:deoxyribodipyrimidine photolyase-related protein